MMRGGAHSHGVGVRVRKEQTMLESKTMLSPRFLAVATFATLGGLLTACTTIKPGQTGLLFRPLSSGLQKKPLTPGTYSLAPWNDIIVYNVQLQSCQERVVVLTKDDLKVAIVASVIVRPKPKEVYQLEQEIGRKYARQVVHPKFRTAIRNVLSGYSMVQISKNTRKIESELKDALVKRLRGRHVHVHDVVIDDIKFSQPVLAAIEQKLAKEQQQKQMRFEINIAKKDAEITLIRAEANAKAAKKEAQGKAAAQQIIDKSLTTRVLQLRALESPNSKFFFWPAHKSGLPFVINPQTETRRRTRPTQSKRRSAIGEHKDPRVSARRTDTLSAASLKPRLARLEARLRRCKRLTASGRHLLAAKLSIGASGAINRISYNKRNGNRIDHRCIERTALSAKLDVTRGRPWKLTYVFRL